MGQLKLWEVEITRSCTVYVVAKTEREAETTAETADEDDDQYTSYARQLKPSELERLTHKTNDGYIPLGPAFFPEEPDLDVPQLARRLIEAHRMAEADKAFRDANLKLFDGCDPQPIDTEEA